MLRVAGAIVIIVLFYNFVAIGEGDTTQLVDLKYKSWSALVLGVIILSISYKWWANCIAAIEGFLMIVNLNVAYHWNTVSIFDNFYPQIQSGAFIVELIILCFATMEAATNGRRADRNSYLDNYRNSDFMRSGGG